MNSTNSEWRFEQIAYTILYRCFGNITMEKMPDRGVVDFIVNYNDGTDLQFGVIVKKTCSDLAPIRARLVEKLESLDYTQDINRKPIILMIVDELSESAKIAFLLGWRFGRPRIYKNFELRNLNQKTADICLQLIKSMDNIIRILSTADLNVLKKITINKKSHENRIQQAEIVYLRKLSATYRMSQKEVIDEKECFERLLNGKPEEEYPQDDLDNLIYGAVKSQFKNAKVKSSLMLFSTDLDDLQRYKDIYCHHTTLLVSPNLTEVPVEVMSKLDGLEMFNIAIDVFVDNIFYQNAFDDISFIKGEPLEGWVKKVTEWNKLKETMRPVSAYFR